MKLRGAEVLCNGIFKNIMTEKEVRIVKNISILTSWCFYKKLLIPNDTLNIN